MSGGLVRRLFPDYLLPDYLLIDRKVLPTRQAQRSGKIAIKHTSSMRAPIENTHWPDYRAVWRWHFYASLFCMPFVVVLSITGAMYLFKPQIDAWQDRPYDNLRLTSPRASLADQVQAALAAVPGSFPKSVELPRSKNDAGRVIVTANGEDLRVYVDPETLHALHIVAEKDRFTRWLFRLHGELLAGDNGSHIVELAASWTIIMILSGLYLWWPRQARHWGGIIYPRLTSGSRLFWRDLHSVAGVWISALALFLLVTGLPWASFWGSYFKMVRQVTGTAVAQQDWSSGGERRAAGASAGEHGDHRGHGSAPEAPRPWPDLNGFDRVAASVIPLQLEHPVVIAPPQRGAAHWTAKSMTQNRPRRVNLVVDGTSGEILRREDFQDRHWVDRAVGIGIAAHEGQLFGWLNQLLGLLTALGLNLLCVSGVVMWWRRRDRSTLGAPRALKPARFSWRLLGVVLLLAVYLPLFGASLLLVLVTERLILRSIPGVREWLGLGTAAPAERHSMSDSPSESVLVEG